MKTPEEIASGIVERLVGNPDEYQKEWARFSGDDHVYLWLVGDSGQKFVEYITAEQAHRILMMLSNEGN